MRAPPAENDQGLRRSRKLRQRLWRLVGAGVALVLVVVAVAASFSGAETGAGTAGTPTKAAKVRIAKADSSRLGESRIGAIRDHIVGDALLTLPKGATGDSYRSRGMKVQIWTSPEFLPDAAAARSWANFLTALPQASDAEGLTVYFASESETASICGAGIVACYQPSATLAVLPGSRPAGAAPVEEIAAHVFGHHIASQRSNYPWRAIEWGPKRWSTYQRVCQEPRGRRPSSPRINTHRTGSSEGWAEAYRAVAGGRRSQWGAADKWFKPNLKARRLVLDDARRPWTGNADTVRSGSFEAGAGATQTYRLPTPLDGRIRLTLQAGINLDVTLAVKNGDSQRTLGKDSGASRQKRLVADSCGEAGFVTVVLRLRAGSGSYRLMAEMPRG